MSPASDDGTVSPASDDGTWPLTLNQSGLLAGVRVLDCTRLLPVAYGTQMLADLGASVLKVEPPGGEYGRAMRAEFAMSNRDKGSVELDLGTNAGRQGFLELVKSADVVVESFRPGVMTKLKLDYVALRGVNPAIILCSISGYGQTGDNRGVPGHDLNYWSVAGGIQVAPGRAPQVFPVPVADMATGMMTSFLVSAAVAHQKATGRGTYIDLGMADVCLSMNTLSAARAWNSDDRIDQDVDPRLQGLPWPSLLYAECPCYGTYSAADGRQLSLGCVEPHFWKRFIDEIGRPDFEADRLAEGQRALDVRAELQAVFAQYDRDHWLRRLAEADVCVSPVNTIDEARSDPVFAQRDMIWTDDEGVTHIAFPASLDGQRPGRSGSAPTIGKHNLVLRSQHEV